MEDTLQNIYLKIGTKCTLSQVFGNSNPNFTNNLKVNDVPVNTTDETPTFDSYYLQNYMEALITPIGDINTNSLDWRSLCMSSSGRYQIAVSNPGYLWKSSNYAKDWTNNFQKGTNQINSLSRKWTSVAMSGNGRYQLACEYDGKIWRSADFGENWTTLSGDISSANKKWISVAVSTSGKYQTAVIQSAITQSNAKPWRSQDYGVTWVEISNFIVSGYPYNVSMNSSGKYQLITCNAGNIFTSNDYGKNWTQKNPVSNGAFWIEGTISSSGKYQTMVSKTIPDKSVDGKIWRSTDYGENWAHVEGEVNSENKVWNSVKMTSSGKYQVAIGDADYIWYSEDYGENWISTNTQDNRYFIALSSSGQYSTLCTRTSNVGKIYTGYSNLILDELYNYTE